MLKIELFEEKTFCARAGDHIVRGLYITSEWEGLKKVVDGTGRHMIVSSDGAVISGTDGLLHDLRLTVGNDQFVNVPATTLPGGEVVPAFRVGKYACSKGEDGRAVVDPARKPWVNINFHDAKAACKAAGFSMITERQWLAIAHQVWHQDANWTGGEVGEGKLFQGLHRGTVSSAQDGNYESEHENERRWFVLANGERIYDIAGNVWQWVFDDVQGDADGKISRAISNDSISRSVAPAGCNELGGGYQPTGECNWSGRALLRGGYWCSNGTAGVCGLDGGWPVDVSNYVGFRCTN
jgi:formylglycine-generating enzyme required for sulfatase activity